MRRMMQVTALLGAATLALAAAAASTATGKKQIQCWTDSKGQRACGDRLPPEYASQERQVFDKQGRVIETKPREKTPEELAEDARLAAAAVEAARQKKEAAAYDRFLTDTYSSVKDLERARNDRLATLDGRSRLAQKAVETDEKVLTGLKARQEAMLKANKPIAAELNKQLLGVQKALRDNREAIEHLVADRGKVCVDFDRDIKRYQELQMGSATYVGACPAPGSLVTTGTLTKKKKPKKTPPPKNGKKPAGPAPTK
ncbi:MAG TPA: hypothetical protein VLI06_08150 [Solimonas sp.]|nr:hypothetical protein [Solimonas sp.]